MPSVKDLARRPIVLVALLLSLSAAAPACSTATVSPAAGAPSADTRVAARDDGNRREATREERSRYAERERSAAGLEKFEGGRIDTTAIIIILLLVIVIVLIV
jgi:hypothetical protein